MTIARKLQRHDISLKWRHKLFHNDC